MTPRRSGWLPAIAVAFAVGLLLVPSLAVVAPNSLPFGSTRSGIVVPTASVRSNGRADSTSGDHALPRAPTSSASNPTVYAPCPPSCLIAFTETGLPGDPVIWWASLNGTATKFSINGTISFLVKNATYTFNVGAVGYTANPSSGSETMIGKNITVPINFTANATSGTLFGLPPDAAYGIIALLLVLVVLVALVVVMYNRSRTARP